MNSESVEFPLPGRRFLVTGGTGFIGAALVKALVSAGAVVRSLDNGSRGSVERLGEAARDVQFVSGDVRDLEAVVRAARGVDSICHLAYVNGTEFFYSKPEWVLEVAVKGMMNIIDACLRNSVPELVLASSSEVYQTPPKIPTDESAPLSVPDVLNPRYSYGGGKIISELLAINYGRRHIPRVLIFRPHNVYGPNMGWEHVIPQFAQRMATLVKEHPIGTIPFPIQGSGKETRAFIFIDDLVGGVMRVLDKGEHLGIYHIGTEEEVTIESLAQEVARHFNRDIVLQPGTAWPGGTARRCPNVSKMRALGFKPRVPLLEGLAKTVPWYAANRRRSPDKQE